MKLKPEVKVGKVSSAESHVAFEGRMRPMLLQQDKVSFEADNSVCVSMNKILQLE